MKTKNNSAVSNLLAVIITVLVLVVAWKVILPGYASSKAESSRMDKLITAAQEKKDSLDQVGSDLNSMNSAYKAITIAVPGDADESNTIAELEAIATKSGIVIPSISMSEASPAASADLAGSEELSSTTPGTKVQIAFSVSGTFDQLNSLVTSLEKSVKFMNIINLTYSVAEGDQIGLSLVIDAFTRTAPSAEAVAS